MAATSSNVIIRHNPWQNVWRSVVGDRLLAALILVIALHLTAAALLPQTPPLNSAAYARWLSDTQIRFGGAFGLINALGLFDVIHALLFRALLGLLGFILIARLADRLNDWPRASRFMPPPDHPAAQLDSERATATILARLRGYRIRTNDDTTRADRFPLAQLASIAAHAGPLLILIGLLLSPLIDRRIDAVSAIPNATTPIPGTPYALNLIASRVDDQGGASLALLQDGQPIAQGIAAPGRSIAGAGFNLYVRDLLPALRVSGTDRDGQRLDLQTHVESAPSNEVLLVFNADRPDAFFAAPKAGLAVRVSLVGAPTDRVYQIAVITSPGARSIVNTTVKPGERVEAEGHRFAFEDDSHAVVDIVQAPAQTIVVIGVGIAIAGLLVCAMYPARCIWLTPTETGTRIACDDPDFDLHRLTSTETQA